MSLDEALEILGIDEGATPQQARRAYLRLLRNHKPEKDPEGFQLLRGAYELAAAALFDEEEDPGLTEAAAPRSHFPARPVPHPIAEPDRVRPEPAPSVTLEAAPEPPSPPVPAAIEGRTVLHDVDWCTTCRDRLEAGDLEAAAAILDGVLARDPRLVAPRELMELVLESYRRGRPAAGQRLFGRYSQHLKASGEGARLFHGQGAARLALLRELCALPLDFPKIIGAELARAIAGNDLEIAVLPAQQWAATHQLEAIAATRLLRAHAPTLYKSLSIALDPKKVVEQSEAEYKSRGGGRGSRKGADTLPLRLALPLLMGLMALARTCNEEPRRFHDARSAPKTAFDAEERGAIRPAAAKEREQGNGPVIQHSLTGPQITHLQNTAQSLCLAVSGARDGVKTCGHAQGLAQALEHQDCQSAGVHLRALEPLAGNVMDWFSELRSLHAKICIAGTKAPTAKEIEHAPPAKAPRDRD